MVKNSWFRACLVLLLPSSARFRLCSSRRRRRSCTSIFFFNQWLRARSRRPFWCILIPGDILCVCSFRSSAIPTSRISRSSTIQCFTMLASSSSNSQSRHACLVHGVTVQLDGSCDLLLGRLSSRHPPPPKGDTSSNAHHAHPKCRRHCMIMMIRRNRMMMYDSRVVTMVLIVQPE